MKNIIISALNRYLQQDHERACHLNQIEGKIIRIVVREINLDLIFSVKDTSLLEMEDVDITADVEINVSAKILPDYFMGVERDQLIKSGSIEIKGDTHVASVLQNTLREIEIDWEEIISRYIGDMAAYQLGKGARALHGFGQRLRENMRQDLRDYLQDNIQVAATQEEVDQFIKEVDMARAQVDRLEARIARLQTHDS